MKKFFLLLIITAFAMKKDDVEKAPLKNSPKASTDPEHTTKDQDYFNPNEILDLQVQFPKMMTTELVKTMDQMKCKRQNNIAPNWWLPKSLDANLWLKILAMIGNCENLSKANATWNKFFHTNFNMLTWPDPLKCGQSEDSIKSSTPKEYVRAIVRACPWKLVEIFSMLDYKYEMVTAPAKIDKNFSFTPRRNRLAMKFNGGLLGVILDPSKTLVSFRFENRNYALKCISPDIQEQTILFTDKTIDDTNENAKEIQIEQNVWGVPRSDQFYIRSFFHPDSSPLDRSSKTLRGVFTGASINDDITAAFVAADINPKFYPEFVQTLLKRQKKLGYFQ